MRFYTRFYASFISAFALQSGCCRHVSLLRENLGDLSKAGLSKCQKEWHFSDLCALSWRFDDLPWAGCSLRNTGDCHMDRFSTQRQRTARLGSVYVDIHLAHCRLCIFVFYTCVYTKFSEKRTILYKRDHSTHLNLFHFCVVLCISSKQTFRPWCPAVITALRRSI